MRNLNALLVASLLTGCATAQTGSGEGEAPVPTPIHIVNQAPDLATQESFDAKAEAHRFDHAADCEIEARKLKSRNADRGWKLLRACIDRGDFTDLRALLDGAWDGELRNRGDAGELLTKLVAVRGGDIETDVQMMHDHKVPVFTLSDAIAQPEVYEGHLLMMRARVSDLRKRDGQVTVQLDEYVHSSDIAYAAVGRGRQHTVSVDHSDHENGASERHTTTYTSRHNRIEQRTVTDDVETGRAALGKLAKADPFFEPDKDFVVLARFDGVRETASDDGQPMPVVTVLHYFRPGALPLY